MIHPFYRIRFEGLYENLCDGLPVGMPTLSSLYPLCPRAQRVVIFSFLICSASSAARAQRAVNKKNFR